MSNRTTEKATARARTAAMREAQARADRRRRVLLAGGAIVTVLAVVVALVVVKLTGGDDTTAGTTTATVPTGAAAAGVVRAVTSVPPATLDKVGVGTTQAVPHGIDAPPLTANGKPSILYVGAEYCPFCAAERWPVVVALSRFGTWKGLGVTTSASDDVYPDTATLSFHGATFTSDVVSFTGVETQGNTRKGGSYPPLDSLSPEDEKTFQTYDQPPYTPEGSAGSIPFIDFAGKYVVSGASYSPELLAGKSQAQIAAALADPSNPIAKAVDGSANLITAAICDATKGQPANICSSSGVTSAAAALAKAQKQ